MNRKIELKYLFIIFVIFIAACVETDIYLPAFPDMMAAFSVSGSAIQSLLSWNFFGICVSCPLYGPLSDVFGRRRPLLFALGIFLAGSILTSIARDLDQMLLGRLLQGLGSGGCFSLGTAIVFDTFQKERAIRVTNTLNMTIPLVMAVAPMVGGYLNHAFGFRSNFIAIAVLVLISLITCGFLLEETLPKEKRMPFAPQSILNNFKQVLTHRAFWQLVIIVSLLFAGYIAFLAVIPVLFVVEFGMSKTLFPFVQTALLGGWVAGSLFLNRALAKWGAKSVKQAGIICCVTGGLGLAVMALLAPCNGYLLTSAMVLNAFGANWVFGLYFPESMEILPHIKGITASLLTSARLLVAVLAVAGLSALYNGTIYPFAIFMVGTMLIMLPTLISYERRRSKVIS